MLAVKPIIKHVTDNLHQHKRDNVFLFILKEFEVSD